MRTRSMIVPGLLVLALLWPAPSSASIPHPAGTLPMIILPPFAESGDFLTATLIDATETYAYVGGDSSQVLRVRLSDWSNDGFIPLSAAITTALLDEPAGYAYFATSSGEIAKIRLSDFTRVASLHPGAGGIASALLDAGEGFAYFGTSAYPAQVLKVRLSDFTQVAVLPLASGQDNLTSAVLDAAGGYAYFGTGTTPGRIVRVSLADFSAAGEIVLQEGEDELSGAPSTPLDGYAYFITGRLEEPGTVVRLRLSDFTVDARSTGTGTEYTRFRSAALDPASGLLYLGAGMAPDLYRVRLSDLAWLDHLRVVPISVYERGSIDSIAVLPARDAAYVGVWSVQCFMPNQPCQHVPSRVARIRLSDFSVQVVAMSGEGGITTMLDDGQSHAYFGLHSGQIVQVSLPGFTRTATLNLPFDDDVLTSSVYDPATGYAYYGIQPRTVLRVHLPDLTLDGTLTLEDGETYPRDPVLLGDYAYFVTGVDTIVRVRLSDFSRVDTLSLGRTAQSAVLDPAAGYAYYGLSYDYPSGDSLIARVRLADFSLIDTLDLGDRHETVNAAIIDLDAGYAYFCAPRGDTTVTLKLYKVRLSDFTLAGVLRLSGPEFYASSGYLPVAAVFDPASGMSYWADSGYNANGPGGFGAPEAILWSVRLSDFTQTGYDEWFPYERSSGMLVGDNAVFGADVTPGQLAAKFLGSGADLSLAGSASQAGVLPGQPLTYTFALGNSGPRGASGIVLTATLPLSTTFLAASPACAQQGGSVRCTPAAGLRVGASLSLTVTVTVDPGAPAGPLTATALAAASEPDPVAVNNSAVVTATVVLPEVYLPVASR